MRPPNVIEILQKGALTPVNVIKTEHLYRFGKRGNIAWGWANNTNSVQYPNPALSDRPQSTRDPCSDRSRFFFYQISKFRDPWELQLSCPAEPYKQGQQEEDKGGQ
jgi:hypothetical protein